MSSTDEKFDRLMDVMMAQQASHASPPPPEQNVDQNGWFILKIIGGILVSLVTAGLIAGMFWVIQTVSETSRQVQQNEQQRISDRTLDNQKITTIENTLSEVKSNTKDRFTSKDFENKVAPIIEGVNRNTAQIAVLSDTLVARSDFMTTTTTDIALLKRELEQVKKD